MPRAELLGDLVCDEDWRGLDLSYGRVALGPRQSAR
jgi:hypothetical protein